MRAPVESADATSRRMSGRPLLEINNLKIVYDGAIEAVRDVSLTVPEGAIVALLGSNGAGKSTVLKTVSGVLAIEEGEIEKGTVVFEGVPISNRSAEEIVRCGLIQVPEGRRLFVNMTVEENLMMGGYLQPPARMRELRDVVFDLFPRVAERRNQIAGYLSGGEQQMVAVGRRRPVRGRCPAAGARRCTARRRWHGCRSMRRVWLRRRRGAGCPCRTGMRWTGS